MPRSAEPTNPGMPRLLGSAQLWSLTAEKHMFQRALSAIALATGSFAAFVGFAHAQPQRVQVGKLECSMSAGVGFVVGSERNVNCDFSSEGSLVEHYTGTMNRVGLDIGITSGGVIVWAVFADTNRHQGMLAGTYTGASAEVSVAAGLGANVLVGGSNWTVALQPVSVQRQSGFDIAAGIGSLQLHPAP